mmetsp:Transcript_53847/g.109754  ORF Transcript_53847/g.109754 Transcript_53847/m.109754 type:complete len:267 (-) Transcript_53847:1268-2068(-)
MMAPCATSASPSCDSLLSMSITVGFGFDMCRSPTASGTTRLKFTSPYWSMCSKLRADMSAPISSPIATSAMPSSATAWWLLFSSKCSAQTPSSFCTFITFPLPAYAHVSTVKLQYCPIWPGIALSASIVTSAVSCRPRKSRPSPRHANLAMVSSITLSSRSIIPCMIVSAMSGFPVPTNTSPRDSDASEKRSMGVAGSAITGVSSSSTSSLCVPAYASPKPKDAPMRWMMDLSLSTFSVMSARAGSHSLRTLALTIPTARDAPALM